MSEQTRGRKQRSTLFENPGFLTEMRKHLPLQTAKKEWQLFNIPEGSHLFAKNKSLWTHARQRVDCGNILGIKVSARSVLLLIVQNSNSFNILSFVHKRCCSCYSFFSILCNSTLLNFISRLLYLIQLYFYSFLFVFFVCLFCLIRSTKHFAN